MKTRLDKLLVCAVLICALALPMAFGEGETPGETSVPQASEKPTPEPATPAPATEVPATEAPATEAPTTEIPVTEVPATEVPATDAPASESPETQSPSPEPTIDPGTSSEPSPSPTLDPTATMEPSLAPEETPTISPSPSPSATPLPLPGSIDGLVNIAPEGEAKQEGDAWRISLTIPDSPLAFVWTVNGEATSHLVYIQDSQGNLKFISETTEARIGLPSKDYMQGRYTLYVGAVLADGSLAWGSAAFELAGKQGGFPGGMGGFGGGRGGFSGAGVMPEEEQGFRITPGVALTSKHASGTMDDTAYTVSKLESTEEAVSALVLESTRSQIALDGGSGMFFVEKDGDRLVLTPESGGESWQLSVLAMNTLADSGVERVVFQLGGTSWSLPSRMSLNGSIYAALRAQGYVSKDAGLRIDAQGVHVHIAGGEYSINESGELVPLEG